VWCGRSSSSSSSRRRQKRRDNRRQRATRRKASKTGRSRLAVCIESRCVIYALVPFSSLPPSLTSRQPLSSFTAKRGSGRRKNLKIAALPWLPHSSHPQFSFFSPPGPEPSQSPGQHTPCAPLLSSIPDLHSTRLFFSSASPPIPPPQAHAPPASPTVAGRPQGRVRRPLWITSTPPACLLTGPIRLIVSPCC
jgi:hypothetical protein